MNKEEFFNECAKIFKIEHNYANLRRLQKIDRTTGKIIQTNSSYCRWGPRTPGNGRFPGFGLVRVFSPSQIFVNLNNPVKISQEFKSFEEVIEFLKKIIIDDS